MEIHKDDLLADWALAVNRKQPFKIRGWIKEDRGCSAAAGKYTQALLTSYTVQVGYFKEFSMITVSSMEAQNRFGQLLDTVQREPVTVTRHGRTAAFIISPRDMQELQDARRKRGAAVEAFDAWSKNAAATALPCAVTLTDDEVLKLVKAAR